MFLSYYFNALVLLLFSPEPPTWIQCAYGHFVYFSFLKSDLESSGLQTTNLIVIFIFMRYQKQIIISWLYILPGTYTVQRPVIYLRVNTKEIGGTNIHSCNNLKV